MTEVLFLYLVFLLACLGLLVGGIVEQRNHHRSLHSIPHRVLVNGIRGKSSITRLTAGALRGGKLVVVAKTTGTAARFIFPDASEEPVYRKFGIANVVEQIGIVRRAAGYFPDALVIECMAVMPPLQELNQTKLIQSTIGILCNVREDHLAEMGPTLDDVARSLSRSMPVGGVCVTAEKDRLHILQEEADKRSCKLIAVDPESVADEEMKGFTWTTFKENVAIALKVAELLGVPRKAALTGMWTAPPDPGVLSVEEYRRGGTSLRFANIFAANDPESTYMNIQQLEEQGSIPRPLHVLINCRPDRVERNGQMGSLISRIDPDKIILIGEPTRSARIKIEAGWQDRVVDLGGRIGAAELLDGVLGTIDGFASVLAIGNIHGQGEILLAQLGGLERPTPQERTAPPARPATPGSSPAGRPADPSRPGRYDVPAPRGAAPGGPVPGTTPRVPPGASPGPVPGRGPARTGAPDGPVYGAPYGGAAPHSGPAPRLPGRDGGPAARPYGTPDRYAALAPESLDRRGDAFPQRAGLHDRPVHEPPGPAPRSGRPAHDPRTRPGPEWPGQPAESRRPPQDDRTHRDAPPPAGSRPAGPTQRPVPEAPTPYGERSGDPGRPGPAQYGPLPRPRQPGGPPEGQQWTPPRRDAPPAYAPPAYAPPPEPPPGYDADRTLPAQEVVRRPGPAQRPAPGAERPEPDPHPQPPQRRPSVHRSPQ
ncbi:poly-gamma-glutamate synthase PgsB [Micromonospora sp. NPDC000089]|uniref:poly-gamma-glutamate synthase PgsB n=1 Tax=unclassified Micromonospora TaxID=2617518 RepID=UPI0036C16597